MKQVVVVGGDPAYVRDTLGKKLLNVGIDPKWHFGWGFKGDISIPDGCEGLVLLAKEANSGLSRSARSAAREAGIPIAECSERKFAQMLPALKTVGLVNGEGPSNVEKADAPEPPKEKNDTHPSLQEAAEWATLYIEDKPERSDEEIVTQIKAEKATNGFTRDDILAVVKGVRSQLRHVWSKTPRRDAASRAKSRQIKLAWGVRFYRAKVQESGHAPTHEDIAAAAKPIFGSGLASELRTAILQAGKAQADKGGTLVRPAPRKDWMKVKPADPVSSREIQNLNGTINLLRATIERNKETFRKEKAEWDGAMSAIKAERDLLLKEVEDLREKAQATIKENGKSSNSAAAVERHLQSLVQKLTERNKALTTSLEASRKDVASMHQRAEILKAENLTLATDLEEALKGAEKSSYTLDDLVKMGWEIHIKPPQK